MLCYKYCNKTHSSVCTCLGYRLFQQRRDLYIEFLVSSLVTAPGTGQTDGFYPIAIAFLGHHAYNIPAGSSVYAQTASSSPLSLKSTIPAGQGLVTMMSVLTT